MRRQNTSLFGITVRFGVFAAVILVMLVGIVAAIQRPVAGGARSFDALFTDVSGLRKGSDVRMYGVAVGKVSDIDLEGSNARVRFSVQNDRPVYDTSRLAIRYQNLTGQRYIDIQQPDRAGSPAKAGSVIGLEHTSGSFDITTLFNGMEPVLREFSPEAVNQLAVNARAVLEGDGSRIGATLDAVGVLSAYVTDRQAVISTLLHNFSQIAEQIGGKSPEAGILIDGISTVFVNLQTQFDGLMDAVDVAPPILGAFNNLLAALGFTRPDNPDLDADLRLLFPDPQAALDTLGRLPAFLQSLVTAIPARTGFDLTCSHGQAQLPAVADILISGQRITVCNNS
ncbi:MCE family protein [Nocardia cyriacigeorgica]|uniref:MCE family protein n=1 Tax=Nocardia cyriacigeorgica TaxID=135487 RepID=A0A5R8P5Q0_9NOCA|nr:MlaD family protein [Nocardia cyriacigeorgica]TLF94956.1 MCE family protein [Nocardia cyriacigeorgica]